jgi:hypothetical protein
MRPDPARLVAATRVAALSRRRRAVGPAGIAGLSALLGLTGLAAAAVGAANAAAASPGPSAQAEYNAALKAAGHQSVHFESSLAQGGVSIKVSGDSGATSGSQTITVKRRNLTEHVSAMLIGNTGYLNANAAALHYVVGLTNAQAAKYAGKWLWFPASSAGLAELVAGLENAQVANELQMTGPYTYLPTTTVNGQRARAIRGYVTSESGSKVPVVLYVPVSGTPTPIEEVTNPGAPTGSPTIHGTVTLSNWGLQTTQTAPPHPISLLKLGPPTTSGATTTTGG